MKIDIDWLIAHIAKGIVHGDGSGRIAIRLANTYGALTSGTVAFINSPVSAGPILRSAGLTTPFRDNALSKYLVEEEWLNGPSFLSELITGGVYKDVPLVLIVKAINECGGVGEDKVDVVVESETPELYGRW